MTAALARFFAAMEPKIQAASASGALAGLLLWLAQKYLFKGTVPAWADAAIYIAAPALFALAGGWLKRSRGAHAKEAHP